jgi:hypothetical protein
MCIKSSFCRKQKDETFCSSYISLANSWFRIDVAFEMRTVLYGMHLFNDNVSKHGHHIYMKRKEGGKRAR